MTRLTGTAQHLLAPRSIALVGASADERKHSALPLRYLRRHGYDRPIYPVNPNRALILGEPAYPSVRAIGQPVDHAFILVPTAAVDAAIDDCVAAGVRCATILSDGFAESGEPGRALQERVIARAGGEHALSDGDVQSTALLLRAIDNTSKDKCPQQ